MKTLLEELREVADDHEKYEQGEGQSALLNEAADEIERLRSALENIKRHQETVGGNFVEMGTTWHIAGMALMPKPRCEKN